MLILLHTSIVVLCVTVVAVVRYRSPPRGLPSRSKAALVTDVRHATAKLNGPFGGGSCRGQSQPLRHPAEHALVAGPVRLCWIIVVILIVNLIRVHHQQVFRAQLVLTVVHLATEVAFPQSLLIVVAERFVPAQQFGMMI